MKHMRVPSDGTTETSTLYLTPKYPAEVAMAPNTGDYQPIWEKPLPKPPNNDQLNNATAGTSKRNNEDVYNMSLSSNSTDYEKKKYYVLDKDYMNTAELQQMSA